jgi:uncharacterized protein YcbX
VFYLSHFRSTCYLYRFTFYLLRLTNNPLKLKKTYMTTPAHSNPVETQINRATVTALYYYPVKSCAGIRADSVQVTPTGIRHDRELMLVESGSNEFLTQRELPRMALVRPFIKENSLRLEAPGMPGLEIEMAVEGVSEQARVWKDTVRVVDQGREVARWFSDFLKKDCKLVRMVPGFTRQVNQNYALSPADRVGFADAYQFLIISDESLADLNRRLAEPLPMNRFRPNIVIGGSELPFAEDMMRRFKLGELVFQAVKPCARCPITTTDQATAQVGKEPLKTLATFRRGPKGTVMFGQNLIHENTGTLRVGAPVEVLALKEN